MSLSDKIKQLGLIEAFEANDVKKFIKDILEDINQEFHQLEIGVTEDKVKATTYVFKQVIREKIKRRAGEKLVEAAK